MMNYNPTVNDVSGQILGQGLERKGAYDAQAIQAQAEADLAKAMRQHSNIVKGVGVVGDVVKLAASIYTGGAAGAARYWLDFVRRNARSRRLQDGQRPRGPCRGR